MVKDLELVEEGRKKIDWASAHMPVLNLLGEKLEDEKTLEGVNVGIAIHLEFTTAYLAKVLARAGANVAITGSNPLSTQDDVVAALEREENMSAFAKHGASEEEFYKNYERVLETKPDVLVDDGGDLVSLVHEDFPELLESLQGVCEETTTGVNRLRSMERAGDLKVPAVAVNDAKSKYLFDSQHGTGQSTWDGIMRTTNLTVAGSNVVVGGYGPVGKGIAKKADGLGAKVTVTEVDPIRALEAVMEGYEVSSMSEAVGEGDFFVTATGNKNIIGEEHFPEMKDGVVLANSGHFDVEIDVEALERMADKVREVRENVEEYTLGDKRIYLLGGGRLVNLACGDGHAAEIMDMSFALQAKSVIYCLENDLENKVYDVPESIDRDISRLKLESMGIEIDEMTEEQRDYLESWKSGT